MSNLRQIQEQLERDRANDPRFRDPRFRGPVGTSPTHPTQPSGSGDGDVRFDPRTGERLAKGQIPRGDGTSVTIDFNPSTGGVFLDRGELEALSKIPEVKTSLEAVLMTRQFQH